MKQYREVIIDGEIFLECTECSADKGNCSCWNTHLFDKDAYVDQAKHMTIGDAF